MTTKTTGSFNNNTTPPVDAQYLNIQRDEMNALCVIDGTTLDSSGLDNSQQAQAVKAYVSQAGILCTDSGSSANSYILTASSPFTNPPLKTGTRVRFKTANANTGSSTITPFGGPAITCKKSDGSTALTTGDIPANTEVEFVYNGTNFVQSLSSSANINALAGLNGSANKIPYFNGVGSMALADRAYQFSNLRVFTSSTTYTPAARALLVKLVGGGGGGAGSNSSTVCVGGGGGGGGAESFLTNFTSTVSITIGAGGTAGSNSNGGNGGATSFGSYLSATGGSGGAMGSGNGSVGGIGTVSSGNGFAVAGSGGGTGQSRALTGSVAGDAGGNGGNSMLGGGGRGGNYSGTVGGAGNIGGGGGSALTTGGVGGDGIVLVYEFN